MSIETFNSFDWHFLIEVIELANSFENEHVKKEHIKFTYYLFGHEQNQLVFNELMTKFSKNNHFLLNF